MGNASPGRRSAILAAACLAGVAAIVIALHVLPSDETRIRLAIPDAAAMPRSEWRRLVDIESRMMSAGSVTRFEDFERNLTVLFLAGPPNSYDGPSAWMDFVVASMQNPAEIVKEMDRRSPVTVVAAQDIERFTCQLDGDRARGIVEFDGERMWRGRVEYRAEKRIGVWTITEFRLPASRMGTRLDSNGRWKFFAEGDPK